MSDTKDIPRAWNRVYTLYRDPPEHRYQAIEILEDGQGWLLVKTYGGHRGDGTWSELVIPAEERNRLADALRLVPEAQQ